MIKYLRLNPLPVMRDVRLDSVFIYERADVLDAVDVVLEIFVGVGQLLHVRLMFL